MTALAADRITQYRGTPLRQVKLPVAASTTIYKGGLVGIDGDGFAIPASDTASQVVAGIASEGVDNSSGSDGDLYVTVDMGMQVLLVASSITQAMLGTPMYVVDDQTFDDAAGPTNDVYIGRLTEFVSSTSGWVMVPGLLLSLS